MSHTKSFVKYFHQICNFHRDGNNFQVLEYLNCNIYFFVDFRISLRSCCGHSLRLKTDKKEEKGIQMKCCSDVAIRMTESKDYLQRIMF